MLKNYLKIACRNVLNRKFYSSLNILGLAAGMTFSLLIGVFIYGELQVDRNLKDIERTHILNASSSEKELNCPMCIFAPTARSLKDEYPHLVDNYYRWWDRSITVSKGDLHFREETLVGDPSLLDMFGFAVLHGEKKNLLKDPNTVVITKSLAIKYFGKSDVAGQTLILETEAKGNQTHQITAVLEDLPRNSVSMEANTNAQMFLPVHNISSYGGWPIDNWHDMYMIQYIKLSKNASVEEVNKALATLVKKHAPEDVQGKITLNAIPLKSYYLVKNKHAKRKLVFTLSTIGIFILLMAIINFVNISIGTSTYRIKEIGIRKAIGGMKEQLIFQFLSESLIITCIAALFSLLFYQLLRPYSINILGNSIPSLFDFRFSFFLLIGLLTLLVGILAGTYPAFVLASYNSVDSLKGKLKTGLKGILFRKGIVTFQFILALFVFLSTVIISRQVSYFFNKNLGYDKSSLLTISSVPRVFTDEGVRKSETVKNELKKLAAVENASLSWVIPDGNYGSDQNFYKSGNSEKKASLVVLGVDEDFQKTYGLKLKEGKFFKGEEESWQKDQVVFNEAAVKALGLKKPTGEIVKIEGADVNYRVAGVVEDFNFFSLHEEVKPSVFVQVKDRRFFRYISVKLKPGNLQKSIASVHAKWKKLFPDAPFEYKFMDEKLEGLYQSELQLKKASSMATYLSAIIVMLGVLGLVSLSLAKRTKEIGIRKVLGASLSQINFLFFKEFIILLVIANLIAWPLSYWIMKDWLQNFVYRIDLTIVPFLLVSILMFLLPAILIFLQSIKIAMASPVTSLRSE